jgi:methyl-accepting chemotaxis protein
MVKIGHITTFVKTFKEIEKLSKEHRSEINESRQEVDSYVSKSDQITDKVTTSNKELEFEFIYIP